MSTICAERGARLCRLCCVLGNVSVALPCTRFCPRSADAIRISAPISFMTLTGIGSCIPPSIKACFPISTGGKTAGTETLASPIWQAGLASVSVPAVFPPVLIGKHALIDGGMHDPIPVSVIKEMGADILIASALRGQNLVHGSATDTLPRTQHNRHKRAPRSAHIVDMLLHSYSIAMTTISMHSMREADVVIQPKLHRVPLYHFSEGHKFVMAGY